MGEKLQHLPIGTLAHPFLKLQRGIGDNGPTCDVLPRIDPLHLESNRPYNRPPA